MSQNIAFSYSYTNADKIRRSNEIIFPNPEDLSLFEIEYQLKSRLRAGEQFDPYDFMVPSLYGEYADLNINPRFHDFEAINATTKKATDKRSISDFINSIK